MEMHEIPIEYFNELTPNAPNDDYDYVRDICQWYAGDELVGSGDMAAVSLMASYVFDDLVKFVRWSRTKSTSLTFEYIDETLDF